MKKLTFIFALTFLFGTMFAQEFSISGKIKGLGNESMVLSYRFESVIYMDTITAKNDVISFKKDIQLPNALFATLSYIGANKDIVTKSTQFFIDNGASIVLDGDLNDLYTLKASSSPWFGEVAKLREENKKNYYDIAALRQITSKHAELLGEDITKTLKEKITEIQKTIGENQEKFIESNKGMVYTAYLYSTGLLGKSADEVEKIYNGFAENVKQSVFGKQIFNYMETAKKVAPGAVAPAFTQKDINGKTVTFKQFKGKYVLLCFWGSWCGPCRRSHPHLMELVNKYQGKNFQAIGFAADKNKDKWKEAIETDKLNFIHCNLYDKYKGEDVAVLYNVKAFPTKVLIDPQGKIVGTVIGMGEDESKQLDDMLEKALGK